MTQITLYTGGGVSFSPQYAEGRTVSSFVRLVADEGMMLTNGEVSIECVDVLSTDVNAWSEVPYVEPNPEPTADPATPAWDIHSTTAFAVGNRVTSDGTVYECIKAHNASWTRQPPNAEYWRTV